MTTFIFGADGPDNTTGNYSELQGYWLRERVFDADTINGNHDKINALTKSVSPNEMLFELVAHGILLNLVGIFGFVGNIISMIILSKPQMKSSINYLLIGLARCDTVLIFTSILLFGLPAVYPYTGYLFTYYWKIYPKIAPTVFPIALIAQTVSVYLTVTVTLERFVAVCLPLRARSLCTYGRAKIYVIIIIFMATLFNASRFFEVDVIEEPQGYAAYNTTVYRAIPSGLRESSLYVTLYIHWFYFIFIYFLPFSALAILNAAIYRQVRRANQERQRLSRLQKKEIGLATMLLCVVVVFFLCNFLALVNNVLESFYDLIIDQLVKTSNLLVTINSSVNFIIYVIFGEKFKRLFIKHFCPKGGFLFCNAAFSGRESPDGATHDDSIVSNGDGRSYSLRSTHTCHLHRSNTSLVRNGRINGNSAIKTHRSMRLPSRIYQPPANVYYPKPISREPSWEQTNTTTLNQL
ncbi:unnamed protein product [Bemisia tabaci]|uniref:G-protein coupled receptors family 1 profile domain-containing protein n=1 Tax=Bemisia tabaci TaxID=7038 RepID=A0A9P0AKK8_BEMTA|nr:PREDICTED: FMRFamide receptor [Bemisia tabaci]CAH0392669.1 unnamed protein product [Bemisia tabaci]